MQHLLHRLTKMQRRIRRQAENTAPGEPAAEDAVPDVPTDEDAGSDPYEDLAVPPANNSAQDGEAA